MEKYQCEICGYASVRKFNVKVHTERVHQRVIEYKCKFCAETFLQKALLEKEKYKNLFKIEIVFSRKNVTCHRQGHICEHLAFTTN